MVVHKPLQRFIHIQVLLHSRHTLQGLQLQDYWRVTCFQICFVTASTLCAVWLLRQVAACHLESVAKGTGNRLELSIHCITGLCNGSSDTLNHCSGLQARQHCFNTQAACNQSRLSTHSTWPLQHTALRGF